MKNKTFFIAATDTDAGKSFITASLAHAFIKKGFTVCVQKWISTGNKKSSLDIEYIRTCLKTALTKQEFSRLSLSAPYTFSLPASPHLSAKIDGEEIDIKDLLHTSKKLQNKWDILLIEGIGGLMVPIDKKHLLIDLIETLGEKVILVARAGLGTINHTLLSAEALRHRNIEIEGIILNDIGFSGLKDNTDPVIKKDNKEIINYFTGTPIFGPIPFSSSPSDPLVQESLIPVLDHILRS